MATVAELKAELDERGVEYRSDARKAELEQLLADAPPEDTEADSGLPVGRDPLPPEAHVPAPPSRADRRAAQPELPAALAARRERRLRQYELRDGTLTFTYPPRELTQAREDETPIREG